VLLLRLGWVGGGTVKPHDLAPESGAKRRAQLLSSYNNNSNNPRRGTDRLRGAW
jgi:hypothetical protein